MRPILTASVVLACVAPALKCVAQPAEAPARAVPFSDVRIEDRFWTARQTANREGTLKQNFEQCEKTGRLKNFEIAAGRKKGEYSGYYFNDSDVFKAIEGACYVLAQTKDGALEARIDSLIELVGAAQRPDGYLNTYFIVTGLDKRFTNLQEMHELYCAGHLFEAAVAHYQVTGKRTLLDIAIKYADLIESTFGPGVLGKSSRHAGVCGHEEIELALIRLADVTADTKYFELAKYFIEQRGRTEQFGGGGGKRELWGETFQDYAPVREHTEIVGHAVRAGYLYAAMTELAMRTGDTGYSDALDRVWRDLNQTKTYVTGGMGNSSHNEGFTKPYDLPNDTAYSETCAGIASVMWNHRMALLHADDGAKYADAMERALFNAVLSGVSLDGTKFFYTNPLASRGNHRRQEWHACACCPPNVLRTIATVGGLAYAATENEIIVNLYVGSTANVTLKAPDGTLVPVQIKQTTDYPWDGNVKFTVTTPAPVRFTLLVRRPGWSPGIAASLQGQPSTPATAKNGYLAFEREWRSGDAVDLTIDMPVERVRSNPRVAFNAGRVAIQRGPIVYCLEAPDNPGADVRTVALPADAPLTAERRDDLLGGVTVIKTTGLVSSEESARASSLYSSLPAKLVELVAIPYATWANRAAGNMIVWVPESLTLADRSLDPGVKASASHCFSGDSIAALYDQVEPTSSNDHGLPRFTWWPQKASTEWVQYEFETARRISSASVYWFDDGKSGGGCRLPVSWKLFYRDGAGEKAIWKEVSGASEFGVQPDRFNQVTFPAITTTGLRIEAKLTDKAEGAKDGFSGGILEWQVQE